MQATEEQEREEDRGHGLVDAKEDGGPSFEQPSDETGGLQPGRHVASSLPTEWRSPVPPPGPKPEKPLTAGALARSS